MTLFVLFNNTEVGGFFIYLFIERMTQAKMGCFVILWRGGQWYVLAPLLGLGGFGQRASKHMRCMMRGGGTGGKPPSDHALKCGHHGARYQCQLSDDGAMIRWQMGSGVRQDLNYGGPNWGGGWLLINLEG